MRAIVFSIFLLTFGLIACDSLDVDRSDKDLISYDLHEYDYYDELPVGVNFGGVSRDDAKASLGRLLFYDTQLSRNNNVSCASCHKQAFAFGESKAHGEGLFDDELSRNSTALTYAAFRGRYFWDGRTRRLKDAVLEPIVNHTEMGMTNIEELSEKLKKDLLYIDLFHQTFGIEPKGVLIGEALASFVGSMYSFDSKFDHGLEVDFINFTSEEKRGKILFEGKALCSGCHSGINFDSYYRESNIGLDLVLEDEGAGLGKFRVASLRNIDQTAPYMHDGRFETLEEVIEHYNSGIADNSNLDWSLQDQDEKAIRLNLTEKEKSDLLAFLMTLSDDSLVFDERFSSPF